ncbi:hypothetical protein [Synechococcus sp. CBW1107]|uniref:hypothetical protein n=1 Tax=Synechococcus sp. CBW1107 TaxID=2789857 RepID=UPI002AD334AA|nr:hypothetical protein [Synechococcus sp. CBW1107]CAK6698880.1 hypothetical protein ICNINCKA_02528 [Synechococcus sp. CBW1107]
MAGLDLKPAVETKPGSKEQEQVPTSEWHRYLEAPFMVTLDKALIRECDATIQCDMSALAALS